MDNIAINTIIAAVGSIIVFIGIYFTHIRGSKVRMIRKKFLNKDSNGIYKISFFNNGSKEGLINQSNLNINGKECFIYEENGKSIHFPIRLPAGQYFTCILLGKQYEKQTKNLFYRVISLMTKKRYHKAKLSYTVTCKNKIKSYKYSFYLLEDL